MDVPVTPKVTKFVRGVVNATRAGKIEWESTADPHVLLASLPDASVLRLAEVPDFDGQSPEPDYVLALSRSGNEVLSLDRRDFYDPGSLNELGVNKISDVNFMFVDLWRHAVLKARKVADVLDSVNAVLADLNDEIPL